MCGRKVAVSRSHDSVSVIRNDHCTDRLGFLLPCPSVRYSIFSPRIQSLSLKAIRDGQNKLQRTAPSAARQTPAQHSNAHAHISHTHAIHSTHDSGLSTTTHSYHGASRPRRNPYSVPLGQRAWLQHRSAKCHHGRDAVSRSVHFGGPARSIHRRSIELNELLGPASAFDVDRTTSSQPPLCSRAVMT